MQETELKPCPFCGGEAEWATKVKHWIVCSSCGVETQYYETEAEAVEVWNRRT